MTHLGSGRVYIGGNPLDDRWFDIGAIDGSDFEADDERAEKPWAGEPLMGPLSTMSTTTTIDSIDPASLRTVLGFDPSERQRDLVTAAMQLTVTGRTAPVDPPRKRRGLTGKRYRIARRRYGRTMRAYRRGLIPGREVVVTSWVRPVGIEPVRGRPGEQSVEFRGVRPDFTIFDEAGS